MQLIAGEMTAKRKNLRPYLAPDIPNRSFALPAVLVAPDETGGPRQADRHISKNVN
jgi:hypothetical protein